MKPCLSFALASLLLPALGAAQITQIIDATGDGLGNPLFAGDQSRLAVDESGNVYVPGWHSDNVFSVAPGGTIEQIIDAAGDGAGHGLLRPGGIALGSSGNVYLRASSGVYERTPTGGITWLANPDTTAGTKAIAVDASGNVYVCRIQDLGQPTEVNQVQRITPGGASTVILDETGDGAGNPLRYPNDVALDVFGNLYVAGYLSDNVFKISDPGLPTQTTTEILDATGDGAGNLFLRAWDVTTDASGNAYAVGGASGNAFKITDPGGANSINEIIDQSGDGVGNELHGAWDITVDSAGNAYVVGRTSHNVFKITDPGGANSVTEILDSSHLAYPFSVAVDGSANVYVMAGFCCTDGYVLKIPQDPVGEISFYCFCDSGAPCGNPDASAGCVNSTSSGSLLAHSGTPSIGADDLIATVSQLPPNQFGLVYRGTNDTLLPFGDGLRCVGQDVIRFPVRSSGAAGSFSEPSAGLTGIASFLGAVPGSTDYLQGWYRDPGGPCGAGFNLSNASRVTWIP